MFLFINSGWILEHEYLYNELFDNDYLNHMNIYV